jgi:AcrR family transcriptional regulator
MPNRAPAELDWNAPAPDAGRRLTREAIVAAAIAIADRDGLSAVSIRRVAAELGIRPMSIYTHIASKDDLVDLMLDEVIAQVLLPEPLPDDWREAMRQLAHKSLQTFLAHAWTLEAFGQRPRFGPNTLRHVEQSVAAASRTGLPLEQAAIVLAVVDEYTLGHAMRTLLVPDEDELREQVDGVLRAVDPAAFPHLAQASTETVLGARHGAFEAGLEAVLDGLERRLIAGEGS